MQGKERQYDESKSIRKWFVILGTFVNHLIVWGSAWGSGVFQVIFLDKFGGEGRAGIVSVIPTLVTAFMLFSGPAVSAMTNRWGCGLVTMVGALLTAAGFILSSAAFSVPFLYFTFTLIGVGSGMVILPSSVAVCDYFIVGRPLAIAVASSGLGVGIFIYPPLIRLLDDLFGWRGTLLILGAFSLNMCVASMAFKPVRSALVDHGINNKKRKILRVKMLKQLPYCCYLVNNVLSFFGMTAYYIHLPSYLVSSGFSQDRSALFVSASGVATMVTRIIIGLVMQKLDAPISLYLLSMSLGGLAVFCTPFITSPTALFALSICYGVGTSPVGPLMPLILAELVGSNAIADGYGYVMLVQGFGSLVGPPVSGLLFDQSSNYTASMTVSGCMILIGSLVMLIPMRHARRKKFQDLMLANISGESLQRQSSVSERPLLSTTPSVEESIVGMEPILLEKSVEGASPDAESGGLHVTFE